MSEGCVCASVEAQRTREAAKRNAAQRACELLRDGMTVGLGTGSTAEHAVKRIGELVAKGMRLRCVPTSEATMTLARHLEIPLVALDDVERIDVTIDGADEVDPRFDLIKGLGGALLREKIVAAVSREEVIIVDEDKLVSRLCEKAPVPVEVLRFGRKTAEAGLRKMGAEPRLRSKGGETFVSDNGNHILDCRFERISDPALLEKEINAIPGVVENGLFIGLATKVVVGNETGARLLERKV
ncbi:MAG: ribose-5-phosphate isomerase RpiA [Euryarchaeota archaeon]|nr:ribose-5-phosphate isomerase RpiA [Euryarchaeota archaeon]